MIWVDREAKKMKERNLPMEWVDDMKTPSGRVHVGALRGVVIHDLMYKGLVDAGVNAKFTYVINDHDPMDGMPSYLDAKKWDKYMGMPLYKIPPPEPGSKNFAETYANEFRHVFESINCHPEIIWSSKLYAEGKMDKVVRLVLNNAKKVREIYLLVSKSKKPDDWIPYTVVCEKCGKLSTTISYKWDGTYVYYRCKVDAVKWTKGCGNEGKVKPIGNVGKLPWRLDWPATWSVVGVTIEGSGKDHMSQGGSYDFGSAICKEVLNYRVPYPVPYEWFIVGGRKMSSSKGVGATAIEMSKILPPEVLRFLIVRTPIGTVLDFDPAGGDTIPNLFDDYDRCLEAHFLKLENKIPQGKPGEVLLDFARIIELSEVRPLPEKRTFLPRFRTIVNLIKNNGDLLAYAEKQKGSKLNDDEKELLEEREIFAQVYLKNNATKNNDQPSTINHQHFDSAQGKPLNNVQKNFLNHLVENLKTANEDRDQIQTIVFETLKQGSFKAKDVFPAFYQTLIGLSAGPKAADLILQLGLKQSIAKLQAVLSVKSNLFDLSSKHSYDLLQRPEIFSIDSQVKEKFPTISVGIAIIKGVKIEKSNTKLQTEVDALLKSQKNLTNEVISAFPEVQSYRKLYKEMGIDWHSRRPSPEALLRRISKGKGLYNVNTCVDAYNLVVMNNRVSSGAFDLDKIKFPTILRFPKQGEKILLLGDKEPIEYTEKELAYFDQNGGYNIDFNYRDSQQTAVTEQTKNILINIDGIYSITREQVEETLKQTIEIIQKYCGGIVELSGIST